ncbi:MAG: DUF4199 domain-containing protein [Ignavibacteriaceae bacterium]|nr:DUF4199 domain-containing protein [Ignavibacteriaceae bacterium]
MKSKYISPLVCGFTASVLTIVPGLKEIGCCLIIPFAAGFSLFLFQKANNNNEKISVKDGLFFGLMTGIFSAVFSTALEILFTGIFHTNEFVKSLPQVEAMFKSFAPQILLDQVFQMYKNMAKEIRTNGFSLIYTIYFFAATSITSVIFGLIGGLLGMAFINRRNLNSDK